jgi:hypothetical protein
VKLAWSGACRVEGSSDTDAVRRTLTRDFAGACRNDSAVLDAHSPAASNAW